MTDFSAFAGGLSFAVDADPCNKLQTTIRRSQKTGPSTIRREISAEVPDNYPPAAGVAARGERQHTTNNAHSHDDGEKKAERKEQVPVPEHVKYPMLHRLQVVKEQLLQIRSRQERYFAEFCPELGRACFVCGRTGHTKKDCPVWQNRNASTPGSATPAPPAVAAAPAVAATEGPGKPKENSSRAGEMAHDGASQKKKKKRRRDAEDPSGEIDIDALVVPSASASNPISVLRKRREQLLSGNQAATGVAFDTASVSGKAPSKKKKKAATKTAIASAPALPREDEGKQAKDEDHLYRGLQREERMQITASKEEPPVPQEAAQGAPKADAAEKAADNGVSGKDDLLALWSSSEQTQSGASERTTPPSSRILAARCLVCGELGHGLGLENCPKVVEERRQKYEERQEYYRQQKLQNDKDFYAVETDRAEEAANHGNHDAGASWKKKNSSSSKNGGEGAEQRWWSTAPGRTSGGTAWPADRWTKSTSSSWSWQKRDAKWDDAEGGHYDSWWSGFDNSCARKVEKPEKAATQQKKPTERASKKRGSEAAEETVPATVAVKMKKKRKKCDDAGSEGGHSGGAPGQASPCRPSKTSEGRSKHREEGQKSPAKKKKQRKGALGVKADPAVESSSGGGAKTFVAATCVSSDRKSKKKKKKE